jgi:hypothetical protein
MTDIADRSLTDLDPDTIPVTDPVAPAETPVEQHVPSPFGFENDYVQDDSDGRIGGALILAFLAGLGVFLAVLATPIPVRIAGLVVAAFGAVMAARSLRGGAR